MKMSRFTDEGGSDVVEVRIDHKAVRLVVNSLNHIPYGYCTEYYNVDDFECHAIQRWVDGFAEMDSFLGISIFSEFGEHLKSLLDSTSHSPDLANLTRLILQQ